MLHSFLIRSCIASTLLWIHTPTQLFAVDAGKQALLSSFRSEPQQHGDSTGVVGMRIGYWLWISEPAVALNAMCSLPV